MNTKQSQFNIDELPASKIYGGMQTEPERADPKTVQSAVQRGDGAAIINLLMRGVHPDDIKTSNGSTAMTVAIADKNLPLVEELLRHKACPDGNGSVAYLSLALRGSQDKYPDKKILSMLLQYGADPNRKDPAQGHTPLRQALEQGLTESALLLLEAGGDPRIADDLGHSAFGALDGQRLFCRELLFLRMRKLGKGPVREDLENMKSKTFARIERFLREESEGLPDTEK